MLICVGALGVSLLLLGLEVTFPTAPPNLSFQSLFGVDHLPLLAASVVPAITLSFVTRSAVLSRHSGGSTQNVMFVPIFCFAIAGVFWVVVAMCKDTSAETLRSTGWLFALAPHHHAVNEDWNYWAAFDVSRVHWRAVSAASGDMARLVVVGILSLPIFVAAVAIDIKALDYSMDQEFFGHGLANVIAGLAGTLPNVIVRLIAL